MCMRLSKIKLNKFQIFFEWDIYNSNEFNFYNSIRIVIVIELNIYNSNESCWIYYIYFIIVK